jgi:hypothetical protein
MTTATPLSRTVSASGVELRLGQSRSQIAHWLEQDRRAPVASSALDCAVRSALPLLGGLSTHPGTAVVLGALARAWLRSGPSTPAQGNTLHPLDVALSLARRHPRTTLVTVGVTGLALWWWTRSSHRPPPR